MRIVQTFWSGKKPEIIKEKFGWYSPQHHLMSWALSCLKLRSFYEDVILYTDKKGYDLLIKKLQLPYTEVYVELDCLNKYDFNLWGLSKIYTYSQQKEPFLHVDGDVFIWNSFDTELLESPLIAQNLEFGSEWHYIPMLKEMEQKLVYFPEELMEVRRNKENFFAYNAGILGGYDIEFIQEYTRKAFEFVNKNVSRVHLLSNSDVFCIFFEQVLFYYMSKAKNKTVGTFLPNLIRDNGYVGFGDFEKVPFHKTYVHLLGPYKKTFKTCELMSRKLLEEYPDYYQKVISLYPKEYRHTLKLFNKEQTISEETSVNIGSQKNAQTILDQHNYFKKTRLLYKKIFGKNDIQTFEKAFSDIETFRYQIEKSKDSRLLDVFNLDHFIWESANTFATYSKKELLNIDIAVNKAFKAIYEKSSKTLFKKNAGIKSFETKWNWEIDNSYFESFEISIKTNYKKEEENFRTIIVPQLEWPYYVEFSIDELDEIILEIIKEPMNKDTLKKELRGFFDTENDPTFNEEDLETLLCNRLEKLIYFRSIRAI